MLLLVVLVATASWSYGFAQENPMQSPISITKFQNSARMTCEIQTSEANFDSIIIHWYKQKEGEAPERFLFISGDEVTTEGGFRKNRYIVERRGVQKRCVLTIKDVIPDDAGTYYCAYWDPHCDRNTDHQGKKPLTTSEPQGCNCATSPVFSLHLSELLKGPTIFCYSKRAGKRFSLKDISYWLTIRCTSEIPDDLPATKDQVFMQAPMDDWEKMGFSSSMGLKIVYTANLVFFKEYLLSVQTQLSHIDIVKALFTVIGYYNKVFGTGTKLVVSEKGNSPPANSEILQKKHENQIMYVCLIEKFYPEIIRVTWTDDEKEITDQVVKGDTWQSTKGDEYSIASWLTVPAENEGKKYYCKYEHEEQKASLSTQVESVKTAPKEEVCKTVFNTDQLMHRTAYLVYIILLLKSSMYYLTVLFFIYRMWASNKYQGKKV